MNAYFMCVLTSALDVHKCNFKETHLKRKETKQCAQIHFLPTVFKDSGGEEIDVLSHSNIDLIQFKFLDFVIILNFSGFSFYYYCLVDL